MNIIEELRNKAQTMIDEIRDIAAPGCHEEEIQLLEGYKKILNWPEIAIEKMPKKAFFNMFMTLGYDRDSMEEIYNKFMEEANKKYILIHPDMVKDMENKGRV